MQRGRLPLVLCAGLLLGFVSLQPSLGQTRSTAKLKVKECLQAALQNNLDLVSARKDPQIAEQQINVNKAPFDGALSAGGNFDRSEGDEQITSLTTTGATTGESDTDILSGDVSFSHLLHYGGSYSISYNLSDVDASSTSIEAATGFLTGSTFEQATNGISLTYDMPLLNGFGKEVNTIDILLARGNLEISNEDLRLQAMLTAQSVEDAYWDTLAASEALRISRLALKRAEDLLALNKKKVEVGTLAPIEITEAEAAVASQVEFVIAAENTLENAEDLLLQLMGVPEDDPMWEQTLELTDRPSYRAVKVDLAGAISTALERRPEMANARQILEDSELSERVAKRRIRHGLDLNAGLTPYQNQDTDRLVEILAPPGTPPSDTNTDSDNFDWSVGLRYTYSFRNRGAKANYAIAQLNTQKSDLGLQNTEQDIRVDVRRSARNLESGLRRVEAAQKNVELQQKKLEAEQKKFDNGMSTSFEVLTFQNDLADAELSEIRARLDYVKALTELERSQGTLLEARGLSLGQ